MTNGFISGSSWSSSWSAIKTVWKMPETHVTCEDFKFPFPRVFTWTPRHSCVSARTCSCTTTASTAVRYGGSTAPTGCTPSAPWFRKSRLYHRARVGPRAVRRSSSSARTSSTGCRSSSGRFPCGASWSRLMPSGFKLHLDIFLESWKWALPTNLVSSAKEALADSSMCVSICLFSTKILVQDGILTSMICYEWR